MISNIGRLVLHFAKKTRQRAISNIKKALPELSMKEVTDLAYEAYSNCAFGVAESLWLSTIEPEIFCDEETLSILQSGQGACIATMHLGCYEAVPLAVSKLSDKSVTLTNIPSFLEGSMDFYSSANIKAINKKSANAFSELLVAAGNNAYISLHCDLYANQTEVTFFGQQTKAPSGIVLLAKLTRKPLLLAYAIYQDDGQVHVFFETLVADTTSSKKENSVQHIAMRNEVKIKAQIKEQIKEQTVEYLMTEIYQRFEQIIKQYPSQWYWSYNRWKN